VCVAVEKLFAFFRMKFHEGFPNVIIIKEMKAGQIRFRYDTATSKRLWSYEENGNEIQSA